MGDYDELTAAKNEIRRLQEALRIYRNGCERLSRAMRTAVNHIDRGLGDSDPIHCDFDEHEMPFVAALRVLDAALTNTPDTERDGVCCG